MAHSFSNTKLNSKISSAVGTAADFGRTVDRAASQHQSYQVAKVAAKQASDSVLGQYDRNTAASNASAMKPPTAGTDFAQRQAQSRKDSSTYAAASGMKSYKKGGKIKKTGVYRLHKNERVLNPKQTKKFEKKGGLRALAGK